MSLELTETWYLVLAALIYNVVNALADALYALADPRVHLEAPPEAA